LNEIEKEEKSEELSLEEVNYVLKFAESLSGYGIYGNAINPLMLNQRMKDITLNPLQATEDSLNSALLRPKDNELVIQEFSQSFEVQSQVYKKLLSYLETLLSFDLTYECINAKSSEYSSAKYGKDLDNLKKFVDSFDYKEEFRRVVQELLRNEAYFGCPRVDGDSMVLQELPSSPNYTLITGRWSKSMLFSFNMLWFLQPGADVSLYPDFFKEKFFELWGNGKSMPKYMPSLPPELRGDSSWVFWQDVPIDVGWCWKLNPTSATRLPYFTGLFLDLLQQPLMRSLQKNINMSTAARILIGEVPLLNKTTQASVKDQFAISSQNLGNFLALVKSAVGEALRTAAVPLSNVQGVSFPAENEVYSSFLKNALASSGINTNLIFTSDVRPNAIESQLSANVDENMMTSLYPQFEQFMNYHANKVCKNYKFKIHFEGINFFTDRQQRFDKYTGLANIGIFLPQKIAASVGMSPFELQRHLEEAGGLGWADKMIPLISSFQMSGKNDGGRPQKSSSELSDSGDQTRGQGNNVEKGGKV
jgi:hypothetical protein